MKGFLKTKLQLVLSNCMNTVIFTSEIGSSKLKNYKDAYLETLRKVFELTNFNYAFNLSNYYHLTLSVPQSPSDDTASRVVPNNTARF